MMSVAELEAGLISARTKAALAAAKARGKALGGFRGRAGTADDAAKARAARGRNADAQAEALAPILARLDPTGAGPRVRPIARMGRKPLSRSRRRPGWIETPRRPGRGLSGPSGLPGGLRALHVSNRASIEQPELRRFAGFAVLHLNRDPFNHGRTFKLGEIGNRPILRGR